MNHLLHKLLLDNQDTKAAEDLVSLFYRSNLVNNNLNPNVLININTWKSRLKEFNFDLQTVTSLSYSKYIKLTRNMLDLSFIMGGREDSELVPLFKKLAESSEPYSHIENIDRSVYEENKEAMVQCFNNFSKYDNDDDMCVDFINLSVNKIHIMKENKIIGQLGFINYRSSIFKYEDIMVGYYVDFITYRSTFSQCLYCENYKDFSKNEDSIVSHIIDIVNGDKKSLSLDGNVKMMAWVNVLSKLNHSNNKKFLKYVHKIERVFEFDNIESIKSNYDVDGI
jgi:hypothetical protein